MDKSILSKILITLVFLLAYRVLAYIPIPGVDLDVIANFFRQAGNTHNALGLFNMFSGNAVERLSIISLGIMPYITASIVMELISASFASIGKMKKERDGMQKYMQIVRYVTIFVTVVQAISVSFLLHNVNGQSAILIDNTQFLAVAVFSMLTGTMLLMWIGEQITQHGVGNGVSLIIFSGIVSGIPGAISGTFNLVNTGEINYLVLIAIIVVILITVFIIVYIELAERRVPISYARKVIMQNQNKRIMNYIPIKINLSGVIPPIFASALLVFPTTMLQASSNEILRRIADFLSPDGYIYNALMFFLVIFFSYFYSSIAFNSKDISENLKRQGGYIPGMRPGENTVTFLNTLVGRLTFFGALYLALISTVPWILVKSMGVPFYFGGTAVLIVVQVAIDTMRKIEAQIYMSKYKTLSAVGF